MADLKTKYLGLALKNPLVAGSSSRTFQPESVVRLEQAGIGAVVLKSIFEEQIRFETREMVDALQSDTRPEAQEYLRADLPMQVGPQKYLERIREIKSRVKIPVIASVNCIEAERWVSFARKIELAGADALEMNIYDLPTGENVKADDVEKRHLALVRAVKSEVRIPLAVKIGPFYSALPSFAQELERCGIQGLVLFNRFFQPDVDIEKCALKSTVNLSREEDLLLPLRWVAILRSRVNCDLALTGGVHSAAGVIKAILAGANSVQICSLLYRHPIEAVAGLADGLGAWMDRHGFATLDAFRGRLVRETGSDVGGFERAQYVRTLTGVE